MRLSAFLNSCAIFFFSASVLSTAHAGVIKTKNNKELGADCKKLIRVIDSFEQKKDYLYKFCAVPKLEDAQGKLLPEDQLPDLSQNGFAYISEIKNPTTSKIMSNCGEEFEIFDRQNEELSKIAKKCAEQEPALFAAASELN